MIPLWIKISYTVFVAITVFIYARKYGAANFLWFSDIALVTTVPALWLESELLFSMMAVAILLPELVWTATFLTRLVAGMRLTGLTDYMFDAEKPRYLRALSLFHLFLPVLLLWAIVRLGYHPTAWIAQTALAWVVLPLTYFLTDPKNNINWVYGPSSPQRRVPGPLWLAAEMVVFPVLVYWPTHLVLHRLVG